MHYGDVIEFVDGIVCYHSGLESHQEGCPAPLERVMQYTGLKDKDGKEIYEGDVVIPWRRGGTGYFNKARKRKRIVEWKTTRSNRGLTRTGFNVAGGVLEVIGNIFENPELIDAPCHSSEFQTCTNDCHHLLANHQ